MSRRGKARDKPARSRHPQQSHAPQKGTGRGRGALPSPPAGLDSVFGVHAVAALTERGEAPRELWFQVIGLRASFGAAHYLAYYLDYLRDDVQLIDTQAGIDVERALRLDNDDLVVGIAFRPETRASVDYCRLAVEQGAQLVALTNHPRSQLAGLGDCRLVAPAEGAFFFNPMSSLFLLVEMLLSRVAARLGDNAVASIRRREALIARLGVE